MKAFLLIAMLCLFSNTFAGEDKLNAIMNIVSKNLHAMSVLP